MNFTDTDVPYPIVMETPFISLSAEEALLYHRRIAKTYITGNLEYPLTYTRATPELGERTKGQLGYSGHYFELQLEG